MRVGIKTYNYFIKNTVLAYIQTRIFTRLVLKVFAMKTQITLFSLSPYILTLHSKQNTLSLLRPISSPMHKAARVVSTIAMLVLYPRKKVIWSCPYTRNEDIKGSEVTAPQILNLITRWKWAVSFTPQPLLLQESSCQWLLNRRLSESQSRYCHFREQERWKHFRWLSTAHTHIRVYRLPYSGPYYTDLLFVKGNNKLQMWQDIRSKFHEKSSEANGWWSDKEYDKQHYI
jgi:hypothetical protein